MEYQWFSDFMFWLFEFASIVWNPYRCWNALAPSENSNNTHGHSAGHNSSPSSGGSSDSCTKPVPRRAWQSMKRHRPLEQDKVFNATVRCWLDMLSPRSRSFPQRDASSHLSEGTFENGQNSNFSANMINTLMTRPRPVQNYGPPNSTEKPQTYTKHKPNMIIHKQISELWKVPVFLGLYQWSDDHTNTKFRFQDLDGATLPNQSIETCLTMISLV